jgi:hypothetical protein
VTTSFKDDKRAYAKWLAEHPAGYVVHRYSDGNAPRNRVLHRAACKLASKPKELQQLTVAERVCAERYFDLLGEPGLVGECTECDRCLGLRGAVGQVRAGVPKGWSVASRDAEAVGGPPRILVSRRVGSGREEFYELEYREEKQTLVIKYGRRDSGPPTVWHSVQPALIVGLDSLRLFETDGSLSDLLSAITSPESDFSPNRIGLAWD